MLQSSSPSDSSPLAQASNSFLHRDGQSEAYGSIRAFRDMLTHAPELPACHFGELSFSRGELAAAAGDAANKLLASGFKQGDVLAVWLPDSPAWLQLLFAAAAIGVIVVPVSTRYKVAEANYVIQQSRAKGLVVPARFLDYDYLAAADTLKSDNPALEYVLNVDIDAGFIRHGISKTGPVPAAPLQLPFITFSTSGTTGNPKLALHTQQGIAKHAQNVSRALDVRAGDVMLCALPLYGVLGFVQAVAAIAAGAACVLLPVFKGEDAARAIERHGVTHSFGSDGLFDRILDTTEYSLASWRRGGFTEFAGLGPTICQKAEQDLNLLFTGLYGMSECLAITATRYPHDDPRVRALGGGSPVSPEIRLRVIDVDTGLEVDDGQKGELQISGYNVMTGYLHNEAATASAFTSDGWFRTGDLVQRTVEGFIYLARLNDGLRLSGYLVDPSEIEQFLTRHEGVVAAQVVAVRRPGVGDVAVAFVRATDADLSEADLLAYCKAGIANYKVPKRIVFVDEFPEKPGPNGVKILKTKLREMAAVALSL
ncbi:3-[(3aS,4S,7aS)-7a-methyl-1, 5-dioxo-octahydro-1H-inden-4-yl]propanoyl:CoA ligase [Paraburkholderia nemoris]|uniref:AMP-binding protein n=1 Tax=Paraburkholderia nemoris TaxID=2793076 RepID=UPI001B1A39FC|nr:AMP-binding protein [Paraburkholderia nemoris]MBK3738828.1 AMP-binding protein [Paraburkholderia aspalathi]CAE6792266.1 3-[(3aS,4S,7aS)-7a-methyl-1, 5-dioxo-octahydro-1H-inden-4-yl]propanoyl:CoA ligase [Paraburkholderia nemoris]